MYSQNKILELRNLKKYYPVYGGVLRRVKNHVKALDGIDLDIYRGECVGVVGESGCGKTTASKAIVRLHTPTAGRILFHRNGRDDGESITDISRLKRGALKRKGIREKLQMVFQDPSTSLNPRMLVKHIITEPLREYTDLSSREMENRVVELLNMVGLSKTHLMRYPHEFSGGQRQRIAVARAIASHPEFLVLDEPTSALDVSVQAQILNLLLSLRDKFNLTYLFVTHHLLVVKYISTRIVVMYLGKIVEMSGTKDLFATPFHPYTFALLSGIPIPGSEQRMKRIVLSGDVPNPLNPPRGCRFHTRCPFAFKQCGDEEPGLEEIAPGHFSACHLKSRSRQKVRDKFGNGM
ncbi:MAG: ABC transporter ATP-binding protein [Desulfobacteraceae bacterium]|nr:ABC transporter ATP-binding protein [Desulfobacteraceae bacterium]